MGKGEKLQPIDPYTQARVTLEGLLEPKKYDPTKIAKALIQVRDTGLQGRRFDQSREVFEAILGYATIVQELATEKHEEQTADAFRIIADSYRTTLEIIDASKPQRSPSDLPPMISSKGR